MKNLFNAAGFASAVMVFLFICLGLGTVNCAGGLPGTTTWIRQFGTSSNTKADGIYADATGVYMAGYTDGTLPGQKNAGGQDAFVRKYNAIGKELWTRQFGTSSYDEAWGIYADSTGVYVAGTTSGILPGQKNAGGRDAFVRKYDASGKELWTQQFGTSSEDEAFAISADAMGVYVAGSTDGTLPGQKNTGVLDAFVRKYNASGKELWTQQFGTSSYDEARGIYADSTGVYVAGTTADTFSGQNSTGGADAFVRKYNAIGKELWMQQFGTSSVDNANSISADATGVYVAGSTSGILPGQQNAGGRDAFVRKYDVIGKELWTQQFGTSSEDEAFAISADATGVYVAGSTSGILQGQQNAGILDAFVVSGTKSLIILQVP